MADEIAIINKSSGIVIAAHVIKADSIWKRFKGLMFTDELPDNAALLLSPTNSIHMFFMKYPIDVVFLDKNFRVVGLVHSIKPWQMTKVYWSAKHALELQAGILQKTDTKLGDLLVVKEA